MIHKLLKRFYHSTPSVQTLLFNTFYNTNECSKSEYCKQMNHVFRDKLLGRYISYEKPFKKQIVSAILELPNSIDKYIKIMRTIHKGAALRQMQKTSKIGYFCKCFNINTFTSDVVEIHQSKHMRQGRVMDSNYLLNIEEMGGLPSKYYDPIDPECQYHWNTHYGVFIKKSGYKQGEIITNKKLIGYVSLERNGELLLYSRIIGHGDHLKNGIMYLLNQEIIRWIINNESHMTDGIKYIMYAGWNDGTDGLKMWKKRTLFKPYYLQSKN